MNNIKLIDKNNEILLNDEEIKYLRNTILNNYKEENIKYTKEYLKNKAYNYDLDSLNNKLKELNLNYEAKNITDAIKFINRNNLFEHLGLKDNKGKKEKLDIPLYVYSYLIDINNSKRKDTKELNNVINYNDNVLAIKNNDNSNIYEVFEIIESSYCIYYSKKEREWYIVIYFNEGKQISYNFIEIYCILANKTLKDALIQLIELLNIKIKNIKYYLDIYYTNLKKLNLENLSKYKYFYKIASKQISLLKEIIKFAIKECYFETNINEIDYTYLSYRYLAIEVKKAHNTITPYINTFALMGFYEKNRNKSSKEYNDTTDYFINKIDEELLENADLVAKK